MSVVKAKKAVTAAGYTIQTLDEVGPIEFITTGYEAIDKVTGGFPRSRITEVHGMSSVGKSEFVQQCLSEMSKAGKVLYIDAENALNAQRLTDKGGNVKNITVTDMHVMEDVANFVTENVNNYDVIVIDSVASLVPRAEEAGETGDQFVGLRARIMGQWMRKLIGPLGKSKCAMVFINQLRESMSMYGDPLFTPGGKALPYAASLRLKLSTTKADRILKDGATVGHWVKVEIPKSRVCAPYQTTKFKLMY